MKIICISVFLIFFASFYFERHSAIKIKITPKRFSGRFKKNVAVRCSLDKSENTAKEILYMNVARKGGNPIVALNPNSTLSYVEANKDEYEAKGKIDKKILKKSYLNLKILSPDVEDTGAYSCNIAFNDETGELVENKEGEYLTVVDKTVESLNSTLEKVAAEVNREGLDLKKIKGLKNIKRQKLSDLANFTRKRKNGIKKLEEKGALVESKVKNLAKKTQDTLKNLLKTGNKGGEDVKFLTKAVQKLQAKLEKEEKKRKEIDEKAEEDKNKVKELEEQTEERGRLLKDLVEKEGKVEKTIRDLQAEAKKQLNKILDMAKKEHSGMSKAKTLETKIDSHTTEIDELIQEEADLETRISSVDMKLRDLMNKLDSLPTTGTDTGNPDTGNPNTGNPNTGNPNTGIPDTGNPDTGNPDTGNPNTGYPDTGTPITPSPPIATDPLVAFSATFHSAYQKLDKNQYVKFPTVVLKTGEHYNPQTGIFSAPVSGLYAIQLTLLNTASHEEYNHAYRATYTRAVIQVTDTPYVKVKIGGQYESKQGSADIVLKLNAGNQVRVFIDDVTPMTYLEQDFFVEFSGYLVKRM